MTNEIIILGLGPEKVENLCLTAFNAFKTKIILPKF
jgi:hypothetical protein